MLQIPRASQGGTNSVMLSCASQDQFVGISVENKCWSETLNRASRENLTPFRWAVTSVAG